jgi:hypothetical protein
MADLLVGDVRATSSLRLFFQVKAALISRAGVFLENDQEIAVDPNRNKD